MTNEKIPHLHFERGSYYYQRRVPQRYQAAVGRKKWRQPVGANFPQAVEKVLALTKEHAKILMELDDPTNFRDAKTETRRNAEQVAAQEDERLDAESARWLVQHGMEDDAHFGRDDVSQQLQANFAAQPWKVAEEMMKGLDFERTPAADVSFIRKLAANTKIVEANGSLVTLPPYELYKEEVSLLPDPLRGLFVFSKQLPEPMDDEYHDRLSDILFGCFGDGVVRPSDPDDQDEFDLVKPKLERKIARVARDPDTLSKIAER